MQTEEIKVEQDKDFAVETTIHFVVQLGQIAKSIRNKSNI